MNQHIYPGLATFLCCVTISIQAQTYSGGNGTQNDPYRITSKNDLVTLCETVNNGNKYQAAYFVLTNDIDLRENGSAPDYEWTPIGLDDNHPFCGIFNGNGHVISNLYIGVQGVQYERSGLFGTIYAGGQVLNLTLKDGEVRGKANGGNTCTGSISGLVFCNPADGQNCIIRNCHNEDVQIAGNGAGEYIFTGGITGYAGSDDYVDISFCSNRGAVVCGGNTDAYTGGIVGYSFCNASGILKVQHCSNGGTITGSGESNESAYAGGIAGSCESALSGQTVISNCFNSGLIGIGSNTNDYFAGGITGFCEIPSVNAGISIEKCHNYGTVSSLAQSCGIIGSTKLFSGSNFKVVSCYWNKDVNPDLAGIHGAGIDQAVNMASLTAEEFKIASNFDKNQQQELWSNETARWNIGSPTSAWEYNVANPAYPILKKENIPSSVNKMKSSSVKVYPTTVTDFLVIEGIQHFSETIRLYDPLGRLITTFLPQEKNTTIFVTGLSRGIYYLKVEGETVKIIKE